MTTRQYNALVYIHQYITDHGYAPTRAEIAAGCGVSIRVVWHWLSLWEAMGYVAKSHRCRDIRVLRLPGKIAC